MERCVKPITYEDTKPFLLKVHYARRMPCIKYAFGLFIDNELKGCVTYGTPASPTLCRGVAGPENKGKVLELNRLVICDDTKNNASFLVGRSLRMLPKGLFVVGSSDAGGLGSCRLCVSGYKLALHWYDQAKNRYIFCWQTSEA